MNDSGGILRRIDDSGVPLLLARLLLGTAMLTYAVPKIVEPGMFLKEVRNYHILPEEPPQLLNLVAVVLPWIELLGSIALILGVIRKGAATLFTGLLVAFTVAIVIRTLGIYAAGDTAFCDIKFDCGCGKGEVYICKKFLSNAGLILLAAYAMISRSTRLTLASLWTKRSATASLPAS